MRIFIIIMMLFPLYLSAQTFPYSSDISEKAVSSIEDIAASIISDSFSPMTHYSAGGKLYSAVPAYFKVEQLMDDPEISGEDFSGKSFGAGGGYALTDDLMAYGVVAGIKMDGGLEYAAYGKELGVVKTSGDYSFISVLGGAGYDLLSNDIFSIPVYFGAQIQYFSTELKSDPVTWTTYTVDMETEGNGFMYGLSGGIAFSAKIYNMIKITPYYLYLHNFNSLDMKSKTTMTGIGLPIPQEYKFEVDPVSAGMLGLNIGLVSNSGYSISIALGSMLTSLAGYGSGSTDNGVKMKSYVLIVSYEI